MEAVIGIFIGGGRGQEGGSWSALWRQLGLWGDVPEGITTGTSLHCLWNVFMAEEYGDWPQLPPCEEESRLPWHSEVTGCL